MTSVLYLDRYHLGDPLFLPRLARAVGRLAGRLLLVHGPGEAAERALEAEGGAPRWRGSILETASAAEAATVERVTREVSRAIAAELNEAGVAAVRIDGASRGLITLDAEGRVRAGNAGWVRALLASRVAPVVAALVQRGEGGAGAPLAQAPGGAVAAALALALPDGNVAVLTRESRLPAGLGEGARLAEIGDQIAEAAAAEDALRAGATVCLWAPTSLGRGDAQAVRLSQ